MCFLLVTEHGHRHSWSDGGSDRPRGRPGPQPSLSEGCQAEVIGQTEELKKFNTGGRHVVLLWLGEGHRGMGPPDIRTMPLRGSLSCWTLWTIEVCSSSIKMYLPYVTICYVNIKANFCCCDVRPKKVFNKISFQRPECTVFSRASRRRTSGQCVFDLNLGARQLLVSC